MHPPLACSVRECGRPLARDGRRLVCPAGHAFDVARSGYVSLIQPQDRRSLAAGDRKESVTARARLVAAGIGRGVIDAIVLRLAQSGLAPARSLVAADLGCGSGELLGAVAAARDVCGIGIDLSTAAVEMAARRYPSVTWIVANADRRLPLLDECVDLVLSLNARRNPAECARVLTRDGWLIVGVPAHDDLLELRQAVHGQAVHLERAEALFEVHADRFEVVERFTARERHHLEGEALRDLLRATYRGARASASARVEELDSLEVTLATDVTVFRRGGPSGAPECSRQRE